MPLYEYEEGTSRKFYRIDLDGRRVLLHWGRIGTEGEHQILSYQTERAARDEFDRQRGKREHDRHYTLVLDEGAPRDPETVSKQRLAKAAPLSESPRFLFAKKQRFAWVEARGAQLLTVKGLRADEDRLKPKTTPFETPDAAVRARDAMVAKLLADGYELETFGATAKPGKRVAKPKLADCGELERVVAEDPDDGDRWSVLEDFLMQQAHDPRSDLVRLWKNKERAAEAEARAACLPLLLGKKHASISRALGSVVWRGGYLVKCSMASRRTPAVLLAGLLGSPACALLRDLQLTLPTPMRNLDELCPILGQAPCARSLRKLTLRFSSDRGDRPQLNCELLSGLTLRTLVADQQVRLRSLGTLGSLEQLFAYVESVPELATLVSTLPAKLRSLSLGLVELSYSLRDHGTAARSLAAALTPIANRKVAPALEELRVTLREEGAMAASLREAFGASGCPTLVLDL